jgi:ATP-dependent Lon protease
LTNYWLCLGFVQSDEQLNKKFIFNVSEKTGALMNSNETTPAQKAVFKIDPNDIPAELPILPLNDQVAFPTLNMVLAMPMGSMSLAETAMKGNRLIGVVSTKAQVEYVPLPGQVHETGTVVRALHVTKASDDSALLVAHGLSRFRITEWIPDQGSLKAKIELTPETIEGDIEALALHRSLRNLTQDIFSLSNNVPNEAIKGLSRIEDSLQLAYVAAAYSEIDNEKRQALLEEDSLKAKLRKLAQHLSREKEILSLGKKIKSDVHDEINQRQRDYY